LFAGVSFVRAGFDLDVDTSAILVPTFIQGAATVMFFMPLTSLLLSGLPLERIPAAAGLSNFARFTAGAFGASLSVTLWDDRTALHRAQLVERVTSYDSATREALDAMQAQGIAPDQALGLLERGIDAQARMMSTNDIFWLTGVLFILLAALVWIARPVRAEAPKRVTGER
jgi:DHA2 family multidrug resistance protein